MLKCVATQRQHPEQLPNLSFGACRLSAGGPALSADRESRSHRSEQRPPGIPESPGGPCAVELTALALSPQPLVAHSLGKLENQRLPTGCNAAS